MRSFKLTAGMLLCLAAAGSAAAGMVAVGPIDPVSGFPVWFQDSNGLATEIAPFGDPFGIADEPDPANPFSMQIGFGTEGFWWSAEARMDLPGGDDARLVLAQEAAFMGDESAVFGNNFAFGRLRVRFDARVDGTYVVTHPFGTLTFENVTAEDGVNYTDDNGDLYPYKNDERVLNSAIGPFLIATTGAPAGYLGDPAVDTAVTGSPMGTNVFRIQGPDNAFSNDADNLPDVVETDLFTVSGKLYAGTVFEVTDDGAALRLAAGTVVALEVGNGPGTTLTLDGGTLAATTVNATVVQNGGLLSPGASPGTTVINGDYQLGAGGAILVEIAGLGGPGATDGNDWVDINGTATLDGNLAVDLLAELDAQDVGAAFVVLSYDHLVGEFAGLPDGTQLAVPTDFGTVYLFDVDYGTRSFDSIRLTLASVDASICNPGDADGDGDVDLDDFVILKNNFGTAAGATCATGDFDGDGDVDLDDFVLLKNAFGTTY
ncbi:MAG: hypothetical protein GX591_10335 [Planctomycetes bacterium]|nr:hypothetical protein [Planctomycetota bacterium]